MKIVVIGGSGLIGKKLVEKLRKLGHDVKSASPSSGVNALTGEGLAQALEGAQVVVDVANSPSFEDKAALEFFETAGKNIFAAEKAAGIGHHIALSVVGTDLLEKQSGYFRAKLAQERIIKDSKIPYTIVRATQFYEFISSIAQSATEGNTVRLSTALMQPMASEDVAELLTNIVLGSPINGIIEIAGPEKTPISGIVQRYLVAIKDPRTIIKDPNAQYFGIKLDENMLVPAGNARIGKTTFDNWFSKQI